MSQKSSEMSGRGSFTYLLTEDNAHTSSEEGGNYSLINKNQPLLDGSMDSNNIFTYVNFNKVLSELKDFTKEKDRKAEQRKLEEQIIQEREQLLHETLIDVPLSGQAPKVEGKLKTRLNMFTVTADIEHGKFINKASTSQVEKEAPEQKLYAVNDLKPTNEYVGKGAIKKIIYRTIPVIKMKKSSGSFFDQICKICHKRCYYGVCDICIEYMKLCKDFIKVLCFKMNGLVALEAGFVCIGCKDKFGGPKLIVRKRLLDKMAVFLNIKVEALDIFFEHYLCTTCMDAIDFLEQLHDFKILVDKDWLAHYNQYYVENNEPAFITLLYPFEEELDEKDEFEEHELEGALLSEMSQNEGARKKEGKKGKKQKGIFQRIKKIADIKNNLGDYSGIMKSWKIKAQFRKKSKPSSQPDDFQTAFWISNLHLHDGKTAHPVEEKKLTKKKSLTFVEVDELN